MSALSRANTAIISTRNLLGRPATISRFITEEQKKLNQSPDELGLLFYTIQTVAKTISAAIRASIIDETSMVQSSASRLEELVSTIDSSVHELFVEYLSTSRAACLLFSHYNHQAIQVDPLMQGKYIVCFEALDNIGNIEYQIPLGSVFSVYRKPAQGSPTAKDILRPGRDTIVAAGYILYGVATVIVLSMGNGVHGFTLDCTTGEFLLTDPDIHIMPRGHTYSVNEGSMYQWDSAVAEYVESKKSYKVGKPYRSQYIDSLTADVHRTLKQGGIYINPSTKDFPLGKLELLYEGIPMAFLLEQAGGLASNGKTPILDITPDALDQKVAVVLGSREDVRELLLCYKRESIVSVSH